ncbi:MAG: COG1470 family protein [Planctomycetota bacterium]
MNVLIAGTLCFAADGTALNTHIEVRAENFTVPPATGPLTHILIRNLQDRPYRVTVQPRFPTDWQWAPKDRTVTIEPHQLKRLPFTIEKATGVKSNSYPIEITVLSGSDKMVYKQNIVCASAPYFKPKIDGNFKDWSNAIPVTFTTAGKKTIVNTYWSKRYFYLYVQAEEDKLYSYKKKAALIDAVQFAIAPRNTVTASLDEANAERYEFLVVDSTGLFAKDKCFCLIKPGIELSVARQRRSLEKLELKEAQVVVKRQGRTTVLVHDPDGTGIRDWGKAAGLWPGQRNKFAWCLWDPMKWSTNPPYDSKLEWGLCSSKH